MQSFFAVGSILKKGINHHLGLGWNLIQIELGVYMNVFNPIEPPIQLQTDYLGAYKGSHCMHNILTLSPFIPGRPGGPGSPGKPKSPLGPWKDSQCKMACSQESGIYCKTLVYLFIFISFVNRVKSLQNPSVSSAKKHSHAFLKGERSWRKCETRTKRQMLINLVFKNVHHCFFTADLIYTFTAIYRYCIQYKLSVCFDWNRASLIRLVWNSHIVILSLQICVDSNKSNFWLDVKIQLSDDYQLRKQSVSK